MDQPAGFWIRFWANFLDGVMVNIPLIIIIGVITGDFSPENPISSSLYFLYYLITPVIWNGYVVGKRVAGIRIVRIDGKNVHIGNMLMRSLVGGLIYTLTFGIAVIVSVFMVVFREDKRAIHDFIAGTYVTEGRLDNEFIPLN